MRQRLTTRVAEDLTVKSKGETKESKGSGIDNDVYNMNDTGHEKNDPDRGEYAKGDPSAWGEDVYTKPVNTDDKNREETGHAPLVDKHAAIEAIATVHKLEEKAARCIVASQRALPGADRNMIEAQAASFMHLPDEELNATLMRQEKLARLIAGAAEEAAAETVVEDKEAKKGEIPPQFLENIRSKKDRAEGDKPEDEPEDEPADKDAKKDEKIPEFLNQKLASLEAEIASLRTAAKKGISSINTNDTGMNITNANEESEGDKPEGDKPEGDKPEGGTPEGGTPEGGTPEGDKAKKPEGDRAKKDDAGEVTFGDDDEGSDRDASDDNLLNQIFSTVTASTEKKGAKTLAGLVKKEASTSGTSDLDSILMDGVPPSINHLFQ